MNATMTKEYSAPENLFHKDFLIMVIGQFISLFGNSLQRFALSLYILDLTGSAAIFSAMVAMTFLPQVLLAPFGGAIADRYSKKKMMVCLDSFSGIFLLGFTLFFAGNAHPSLIGVGILMGTLAVIQSIYDPCVRASIPAITAQDNLTPANSIVSVISSISSLLGPVAAGFLYGIFGISIVFFINIVSFLFSAAMEVFLFIPNTANDSKHTLLKTFVSDLKETTHFLLHEKPVIFQSMLLACSFNLFLTPIYTVGFPYMEKILFGVSSELYGISEGIVGFGMIVGALLTGFVSKKYPFQRLYYYFYLITALVIGMGICSLPFVLNKPHTSYLSYTLFTIIGFFFALLLAIVNILCMSYMQTEIPMEHMGKSMALVTSLSTALMPVGQIIFGGLYDLFAKSTIVIYSIVTICSLISTYITYQLIKKAIANGSLQKV